MPESISRRISASPLSNADKRELQAVLQSLLGDMQAIAAQLNTLIDEAEDTDAVPITLNTKP